MAPLGKVQITRSQVGNSLGQNHHWPSSLRRKPHFDKHHEAGAIEIRRNEFQVGVDLARPLCPFAVDPVGAASQVHHHLPAAVKRVAGILLIDQAFEYLDPLIW
jgi:hypothetical protein